MESVRTAMRWLLALVMVVAGVAHFLAPATYLAMMPDWLPWHGPLVVISGVFEILGGLGLLVPATRTFSSWGLVALYIAVFPANVWMATEGISPPGLEMSSAMAWARLPLQGVLIGLAWWVGREPSPSTRPAG